MMSSVSTSLLYELKLNRRQVRTVMYSTWQITVPTRIHVTGQHKINQYAASHPRVL